MSVNWFVRFNHTVATLCGWYPDQMCLSELHVYWALIPVAAEPSKFMWNFEQIIYSTEIMHNAPEYACYDP